MRPARIRYYVETPDGGVRQVPSYEEALAAKTPADKVHVGDSTINFRDGTARISTVWLRGMDMSLGRGRPEVYETVVFLDHKSGEFEDWNDLRARYSTRADAKEGHDRIVREFRAALHERFGIEQVVYDQYTEQLKEEAHARETPRD